LRAPVAFLVAEGVGEALYRETTLDRVAAEMKRAMNLDELHRSLVLGEDRERRESKVSSPEGMRVRCNWRDRRRTVDACAAVAVDDVFRLHSRPHDDAQLRKIRSDVGELLGERSLLVVEFVREIEECTHLFVEAPALFGAAGITSVAGGDTCGSDRHGFPFCLIDVSVVGEACSPAGTERRLRV
jgi:hypothetical protein